MHVRRIATLALGALALGGTALTGPPSPSQAGTPGTWTKISGTNPVSAQAVAGVFRAPDGELVVAYPSEDGAGKSVQSTRLSPGGAVVAQFRVDGGYDTMNRFVAVSGGASQWVNVAYGPYLANPPGNPFSDGGVHSASFDSTLDTWSGFLAPLLADPQGSAATGIGSATLGDATQVTAITTGSDVRYSTGYGGPVSSFSQSHCCAYYPTLVTDGTNAAVAWQGNGGTADSTGVFARQIHTGLGTIYQAPKSKTLTSGSSYALSMSDQPTAAVQRNDGFTYLAYPVGYPTRTSVGLWRASAPSASYLTAGKDARLVALATGPSGRMWVAWSLPNNTIKLVRTAPSGTALGGIRTITKPSSATGIFQIALEATNSSVDVVINGGNGLYHTQVKPGLNLSASPRTWKPQTVQRVVFTVKDAGAPIANARVRAKGKACTTAAAGTCAITFPKLRSGSFSASITAAGYATGALALRVK